MREYLFRILKIELFDKMLHQLVLLGNQTPKARQQHKALDDWLILDRIGLWMSWSLPNKPYRLKDYLPAVIFPTGPIDQERIYVRIEDSTRYEIRYPTPPILTLLLRRQFVSC